MKKIIFVILLLAASASANVDSVNVTIGASAYSSFYAILHAPRYQLVCMSGKDTVIQVYPPSTNNIQWSLDGFKTMDHISDQGPAGVDHDHASIYLDTLYRLQRISSPNLDSNLLIVYDLKGGTTVVNKRIGWGTPCNYVNVTGGATRLGDLLIATSRGTDCNFRYAISDDFFTTQTSGYIADYSGAGLGTSTRMGNLRAFTDSTIIFTAWLGYGGGNDTIDLWWFNPSDSTWDRETNPPFVGTFNRFWSVNTVRDSVVFIAAWRGSNEDTLVTAYRTTSETTWHYDTAFIGSSAVGDPTVALTTIESTGRIAMFYEYDANLYLQMMNDDFTWDSPITIIGGDTTLNAGQIAIAQTIPTSHGSQAYCAVRTTGGTTLMIHADVYDASPFVGYTAISDGDLPLTISTRAAKYYLAEDVSWCGRPGTAGITMSGDSSILDLNGYTISFGFCDSGRIAAVKVIGDSCTIINGSIIHTPTDSTLDLVRTYDIDCGGVVGVDIHDLILSVTGSIPESSYFVTSPYNSLDPTYEGVGYYAYVGIDNILCTGSGYGYRISRNTMYNNTTAFYRRALKQVACINWGYGLADPPDTLTYTLIADSNNYYSSFLNVRFGQSGTNVGLFKGRNNKHYGRVRNDGPWCSDPDNCDGGYRYGEAYAYDFAVCNGFRVVGDTFTVDTSTFGQQGIFFVRASAAPTYDFESIIDSCKFYNGLGPQGGGHNSALRLRYNLGKITVKNSYIEAVGDTITTDSTFTSQTNPLFVGFDACTGSNYLLFQNCTFKATDLLAGNGPNTQCAIWQCSDAANDSTIFDGCTFISDGAFAEFGTYNLTNYNIYFRNCTFTHGDNYDSEDAFRIDPLTEAGDIFILNPTYSSGVTLTYNPSNSQGENQELTEQVEAIVTVHDINGDPVNGANVWIVNSYDTVTQKTTGVSGVIYDTLSTTYISYLYPDTTTAQYNDFTFGAAYSGDTVTATFTLSTTLNDTTLMFGTAAAETDRPVVLNQNIRISGKVIIK